MDCNGDPLAVLNVLLLEIVLRHFFRLSQLPEKGRFESRRRPNPTALEYCFNVITYLIFGITTYARGERTPLEPKPL